ncbi:hypothetical protein LOAG_19187 [Loa loa]|uniref:Uncharacterized protein n=1 Tax=Loa loa TaxID=7209 RepID=A0A1S0UCI8_LOALO|nr:hypothetical protein LOAG_19187 [Loa loa]EJD73390.1 hypothetical protein LOAG_19187 [Loa loa]
MSSELNKNNKYPIYVPRQTQHNNRAPYNVLSRKFASYGVVINNEKCVLDSKGYNEF